MPRRRERHTRRSDGRVMSENKKTLDDVYPKIYDFQELYASYLEARKRKRYRDDVLEFADNLEANLIEIQNELIWHTYEVGPYRPFYVREPKTRLVMALRFKDRVMQWAIYRQLNPFFDRLFIEDSFACRKGKGAHAAMDRMHYWLRQVERKPGRWYFLKLDVAKFFYRVDHRILLDILKERIRGTHKKLRKQTARRIIRRVKFLVREVRDGRAAMESFRRTAASYGGILGHCDSYGLRRKLNQIYLRIIRGGDK